jgi:predicted dehydrogenase
MNDVSRRSFIAQTATVAAAAPLIASSLSSAATEAPRKKLGFALCGLGSLSTHQIAPALQKTKYCRLAGIITGTPSKADDWSARYNIPKKNIYNYDTMDRLADNPDIDVVYVVTPNALHAQHTIAAAKAGKHVLCEKPMEVSTEKCEQMIDACKQAKRMLAIGYRCQFEPNHLECVRLARSKEFGDLRIIQGGFGFQIGDPAQWRLHKALSGGGALMDVGIYVLQTTRMLTGEEPVSVFAAEAKTDPAKFAEVDETITWQAKFPSGVIANCTTTFKVNGLQGFRAFAEKGSFGLDPAYFYNGIHGTRSDGKEISIPQDDQFATEMDDFAQCILNKRPTKVPGEEGLRDVRILMAIYESVRSGKEVKLS